MVFSKNPKSNDVLNFWTAIGQIYTWTWIVGSKCICFKVVFDANAGLATAVAEDARPSAGFGLQWSLNAEDPIVRSNADFGLKAGRDFDPGTCWNIERVSSICTKVSDCVLTKLTHI